MQERFLAKKQEVWMAFVDLEKAFDKVPCEVVWWALRKLRVDEWLVRVIQAMYERVSTAVKLGEEESDALPVRVGGTSEICAKSFAFHDSAGSIVN